VKIRDYKPYFYATAPEGFTEDKIDEFVKILDDHTRVGENLSLWVEC